MSVIRVFVSHDWGTNGLNHARVARVVEMLRSHGFDVWFDETHMKGNILDAMCRGIDNSDIVLVFVTGNYMRKVESGNESDNVRREFMYASKCPSKLVVIRFDNDMPAIWTGPVAMILGSHLYVDLVSATNDNMNALVRTIRHRSGRTLWKTTAIAIRCQLHKLRQIRAQKDAQKDAQTRVRTSIDTLEIVGPKLKTRERVQRIMDTMGDTWTDGDHTGVVVDRLVESITGKQPSDMLLHEKLTRLETELGLV